MEAQIRRSIPVTSSKTKRPGTRFVFRGVLFVIFWKSRLFPSLKSSLQGAVVLQSQLFRAGAGVQVSSF